MFSTPLQGEINCFFGFGTDNSYTNYNIYNRFINLLNLSIKVGLVKILKRIEEQLIRDVFYKYFRKSLKIT